MIDLAKHAGESGDYVRLRDIAERQAISQDYLVQLAMGLKSANLIHSAPGVGGGYALTRSPAEISVLDVIEASIGPVNIVGCLAGEHICDRAPGCEARTIWGLANKQLVESFRGISLADINAGPEGTAPGGGLLQPLEVLDK